VGFLKTLIDGLNHREYALESGGQPSYADEHVVGLHFHHNLAFIEKGDNLEQPSPSWIPRAPMP
jgi:demethylmacrocin O-methyltransferase